jgi:hypothetical protein
MFKYVLIVLLSFLCLGAFAQDFENEYQGEFLWHVKQINEFVERFNNNDTTLLKQYYQKNEVTKLTRERLIKSLFNAEQKDWKLDEIRSFIKYVDNKANPKFLSLYAGKWYAHINCAVTWKGKPETAALTLRLEKLANNGYKWVITDVKAKFLIATVQTDPALMAFVMPVAVDSTTSLNPMSHGTDFMNIDRVTSDKKNIANYFDADNSLSPITHYFIQECFSNRLKVKQANDISYSFMQIDGWAFDIQQYNRQTRNSGWLICKLTKTSPN